MDVKEISQPVPEELFRPAEPVKELRIFSMGENRSTKGVWLLTEQSMQIVRARYEDEYPAAVSPRKKLMISWNHQFLRSRINGNVSVDDGKAAGWADLDFRADGIYLVNIEWSEEAISRLRNREYKYFSPEFYDEDNGIIVQILAVSLTNNPSLLDITPVALSTDIMPETDVTEYLEPVMSEEQMNAMMAELAAIKQMLIEMKKEEAQELPVENITPIAMSKDPLPVAVAPKVGNEPAPVYRRKEMKF